LSKEPPSNFHSAAIEAEESGFMPDLKPINVTQPDGVSFKVKGHEVEWAKWKMHVGFNHREGIVLNDIKFQDEKEERSLFYRLSLAEMVVPYGNGETPHHRKHA
jgi:primary-amine oxidase